MSFVDPELPYMPQRAFDYSELLDPGTRSGVVYNVATMAQWNAMLATVSYGDDVVVAAGTTLGITSDVSAMDNWSNPAVTATTPRQRPIGMRDYTRTGGLVPAAPKPMAAPPPAMATRNVPMATVIAQGDPSYIVVKSGSLASLPGRGLAPANRVRTADTANMPIFMNTDTQGWTARRTGIPSPPAHHWRFEGIQFMGVAAPSVENVVVFCLSDFGTFAETKESDHTHHFIFDRCYFQGLNPSSGTTNPGTEDGLAGDCSYLGVINCHIVNTYGGFGKATTTESHGIWFPGNAAGPFHVENNFINADTQTTLCGGSGVKAAFASIDQFSRDFTIIRNWHYKFPYASPDCVEGSAVTTANTVDIANTGPGGVGVVTAHTGAPAWLTTLTGVDGIQVGDLYFQSGTFTLAQGVNGIVPTIRVASVDTDSQVTLTAAWPGGVTTNTGYNIGHWDGQARTKGAAGYGNTSLTKTTIEFKFGQRIWIEGNVFENCYGQGQNSCLAFNEAMNGGDGYGHVTLQDVTVRYNWAKMSNQLIYIADQIGGAPERMLPVRRVWVHDNVLEYTGNIFLNGRGAWSGWDAGTQLGQGHNAPLNLYAVGPSIAYGGPLTDVVYEYNTLVKLGYNQGTSSSNWQGIHVTTGGALTDAGANLRVAVRSNIVDTGFESSGNGPTYSGSLVSQGDINNGGVFWEGFAGNQANFDPNYNIIVSSDTTNCQALAVYHNPRRTFKTVSALNPGTRPAATFPINFTSYTYSPITSDNYVINGDLYNTGTVTVANTGANLFGEGAVGVVTLSGGSFPATIVQGVPFRVIGHAWALVYSKDSTSQVTLTVPYDTISAGSAYTLSFKAYSHNGTVGTIYTTDAGACTVSSTSSRSFTETFPTNGAISSGQDQPWTITAGSAFAVVANAASLTATTPGHNNVICQTTLLTPDQNVSAVLSTYTNSSNAQGGVLARCAADGSTGYYFQAVPASGHQFQFGTFSGATQTPLLDYDGLSAAAGQVLGLTLTGTSIVCSINSTPVITTTNSTYTTGNFMGLTGFRGAAGDAVSLDTVTAQSTSPITQSLVTLASGAFPITIDPTLYACPFLVSGDSASQAVNVSTRDSATQLTLVSLYGGTTGSGLTATVSGVVPGTASDPGADAATCYARTLGAGINT